jgi:pimeloyl-ACP methyl ester carboxylesterase
MKVDIRGTGRALVYLHPAGGMRWTRVLERLSETHAVHMLTFPEVDATPVDSTVKSPRELAIEVGKYIDGIGKPVDLMGCALSGVVALWLAIERPECVDHMVLQSPDEGSDGDLSKAIAQIQQTTLILHGTEDRIVGKESVQRLKSRLRRAFLVYVWDAAHDIQLDQPERTFSVVQRFLERSDAFMVNYA